MTGVLVLLGCLTNMLSASLQRHMKEATSLHHGSEGLDLMIYLSFWSFSVALFFCKRGGLICPRKILNHVQTTCKVDKWCILGLNATHISCLVYLVE